MKRSSMQPKRPPRPDRSAEFASYAPRKHAPRAVMVTNLDARMSVPKENVLRDEDYRRLVANLPCAHCGRAGPSQAAHADQGKGMGIKTGDDTCYPLCADSPGRRGCHSLIGSDAMFTRDQRRTLETRYAEQTRQKLERA